jgi:hypothetical protein
VAAAGQASERAAARLSDLYAVFIAGLVTGPRTRWASPAHLWDSVP